MFENLKKIKLFRDLATERAGAMERSRLKGEIDRVGDDLAAWADMMDSHEPGLYHKVDVVDGMTGSVAMAMICEVSGGRNLAYLLRKLGSTKLIGDVGETEDGVEWNGEYLRGVMQERFDARIIRGEDSNEMVEYGCPVNGGSVTVYIWSCDDRRMLGVIGFREDEMVSRVDWEMS